MAGVEAGGELHLCLQEKTWGLVWSAGILTSPADPKDSVCGSRPLLLKA
jgi:hypothetical protein